MQSFFRSPEGHRPLVRLFLGAPLAWALPDALDGRPGAGGGARVAVGAAVLAADGGVLVRAGAGLAGSHLFRKNSLDATYYIESSIISCFSYFVQVYC